MEQFEIMIALKKATDKLNILFNKQKKVIVLTGDVKMATELYAQEITKAYKEKLALILEMESLESNGEELEQDSRKVLNEAKLTFDEDTALVKLLLKHGQEIEQEKIKKYSNNQTSQKFADISQSTVEQPRQEKANNRVYLGKKEECVVRLLNKHKHLFRTPDFYVVSGSVSPDCTIAYLAINASNMFGGRGIIAYQVTEHDIQDTGLLPLTGSLVTKLAKRNDLDVDAINMALKQNMSI